ncbi:acetyltransferase (GNAT) family protein [Arenibacter algicola]|uniref:Acetyltransferase (GNAT) family protein n=1 Tax=Arenibacter algicola TaxID=616991 RepID=A0ABY3A908_9FLAO
MPANMLKLYISLPSFFYLSSANKPDQSDTAFSCGTLALIKKTELETRETHRNDYTISTDKDKLDILSIHKFLANETDWANGIPINTLKTSIENSLNFGLYYQNKQIGFARIISDYSTIAYLGDIYVLKEYRGKGLSKWLINEIMEHPNLQGLRRWILLTDTAEWLYKKFGFTEIPNPEFYMEKHNPNVYKGKDKPNDTV